jgi:hypothetical protein
MLDTKEKYGVIPIKVSLMYSHLQSKEGNQWINMDGNTETWVAWKALPSERDIGLERRLFDEYGNNSHRLIGILPVKRLLGR